MVFETFERALGNGEYQTLVPEDAANAEIARLTAELKAARDVQDKLMAERYNNLLRAEKAEAERDEVVFEAKGVSDHVIAFAKVDTDNPVEAAFQMARRIRELTAERDAIAAAFEGIKAPITFAETDDVMQIVKHKQVEQAGWLSDPLFLSHVLTEVLRKRVDRLTPADATNASKAELGED